MRLPVRPSLLVVTGIALILVAMPPSLRARQQANPLPGTKLSLDELRKQMFHVSAGRRLKPQSWPGGARVAVGPRVGR